MKITTSIKRRTILFVVHIIIFCIYVFNFFPENYEDKYMISGHPVVYKGTSSRSNVTTLQINEIIFYCSIGPSGAAGGCPYSVFDKNSPVYATYLQMKMLGTMLFNAKGSAFLVLLEQNSKTIYSMSYEEMKQDYLNNALVDLLISLLVFASLIQIKYFKGQ